MSSAEEWVAIRVEALASGDEHEKDKEIRLLKLAIERQQARLIAMDAQLEQSKELEIARAMYPHLVVLGQWAEKLEKTEGGLVSHRGGVWLRGELRDQLLNIVCELKALTKKLDDESQRPCSEPGCILRRRLGYGTHWHTDGFRQWTLVETAKGPRRYKRGAW